MKWFRLYSSVLNDPKVQQLPPVLFKHWINILCVASEHEPRGTLPPIKDLAFALRMKPVRCEQILESLVAAGLLEWMSEMDTAGTAEVHRACSARAARVHSWDSRQRDSDNIAARVEKHRRRNNPASDNEAIRNVTLHETLLKRSVEADTDTDTERDTDNPLVSLSGKVSTTTADVAPAAAAATIITNPIITNHWDDLSAKRTAEEVARRTHLRGNELSALMSYIKACPHLSHEIIIGEAESFVAWLNKSHKGAEARVFYNRWLKPAEQSSSQQHQGKDAVNGHQQQPQQQQHTTGTNGHTSSVAEDEFQRLWQQRAAAAAAEKRAASS